MMLYTALSQGLRPGAVLDRTLHITIPEDLDYAGVFDPILQQYTRRYALTQVKTTNMGSLFKLTYDLTLKHPIRKRASWTSCACATGIWRSPCATRTAGRQACKGGTSFEKTDPIFRRPGPAAGPGAGHSGLYPHHRSGTVMVPWAVVALFTRDFSTAVYLMVIWGWWPCSAGWRSHGSWATRPACPLSCPWWASTWA